MLSSVDVVADVEDSAGDVDEVVEDDSRLRKNSRISASACSSRVRIGFGGSCGDDKDCGGDCVMVFWSKSCSCCCCCAFLLPEDEDHHQLPIVHVKY